MKLFSKFWTKSEIIEGECCQQVLADGSKRYVHDGLLFELKDFYSLDNVATRTQAPKEAASKAPEDAKSLPLAGLDFGRPKQATIPEAMAADNVHKFQDQEVFQILDKDAAGVVYDEKEQPKTPERIPKDIVGKFEQQHLRKAAKQEEERLLAAQPEEPKRVVVDPSVPFLQRPFKMHLVRAFLTQFDGS